MKIQFKLATVGLASALALGLGQAWAADTSTSNTNADTAAAASNPDAGSTDVSRTQTGTETARPGENMPAENMGMNPSNVDKMPGQSKDMVGGSSTGQGSDTKMAQSMREKNSKLTQDQINVLSQLHQTNQQEIKAGQMAQQKASASDVKSFGKHLESDHKKADDKIMAFAKRNNVTLSNAPAPANADQEQAIRQQNQSVDQLQNMSGTDFDKNFVSSMQTGHMNAIDMVQNAYNKADSGQYKDLLGSILPDLKSHEQRAAHLEKKYMKKGKF